MGKDGVGGGSYSTTVSCNCSNKTNKENVHLATITVINTPKMYKDLIEEVLKGKPNGTDI